MRAAPKLHVERIEDRCVPAVFGNTWIDTNLTMSYTPDGTSVNGVTSNLFSTLGQRMTTTEWQTAIQSAFRAWVSQANVTVRVVSDDGRALDTPGPIQGSPYVGDIRITARPLSDNVLAITNPFDLVSPWAGEIILNSNKVFDTDGSAGSYDLRTVLLQEVGHALGVGNSSDPASVMYEYYQGARTGLSSGDVTSIRALYGAPGTGGATNTGSADLFIQTAAGVVTNSTDWAAGKGVNESKRTATDLGLSRDSQDSRWDYAGTGALRVANDVDAFMVRTTDKAGGVMVVAVGTPLGGAEPKVSVYDKDGNPINVQVLLRNGDATIVQLQGVLKNTTYYVAVSAADPTQWTSPEKYLLGIDFRDTAVTLAPFTTGTLTADQPLIAQTLDVNRSQGFRFQLSATDPNPVVRSAARLTVYDANHKAVFTITARAGQTVIGDVILAQGQYTVAVTGRTLDGSPLTGLQVDGRFLTLTDPIGLVAPPDPTTDPGGNRIAPPCDPPPCAWSTLAPSYYAWLL